MLCERRRGDGAHLHCLLSCTLAFMDLEDDGGEDDDAEEIKQNNDDHPVQNCK